MSYRRIVLSAKHCNQLIAMLFFVWWQHEKKRNSRVTANCAHGSFLRPKSFPIKPTRVSHSYFPLGCVIKHLIQRVAAQNPRCKYLKIL